VELVATEDSFVAELDTIERIVAELLVPMDIVSKEWLDVVRDLRALHVRFVRDLNSDEKTGITPSILNTILQWVVPFIYDINVGSLRRQKVRIAHTSQPSD
jgi:hypothetical protein